MEKVFEFRLRSARNEHYVSGFAASMEISDGRILLKDRRIPWVRFFDGVPIEFAQRLGDLELPADKDHGWAAWGSKEPMPEWWTRLGGHQTKSQVQDQPS